MLNCPIEFYIQGHSFTVIASDAHPIEPNHADSIVISAGERYDIVLNADQPVGHYWFYAKGLAACDGLTQSAIITYDGATNQDDGFPNGPAFAQPAKERPQGWTVRLFVLLWNFFHTIFTIKLWLNFFNFNFVASIIVIEK